MPESTARNFPNENHQTALSESKSNEKSPDLFSSLKHEDLVRGVTPEDIEKRCLELCRTYIGGIWNRASSEKDIAVTRITGGLTNQLYRIRLNDNVAKFAEGCEVTDVAFKMYLPKHMKNFDEKDGERLSDTLVLTLLSHAGIGPKVYGIFKDGFLSKFYENEEFGPKHQRNPQLIRKLAHLIAHVHHLKVPLGKSPDLLIQEMVRMFDYAYQKCEAQSLIDGLELKYLNKYDPRKEMQSVIHWIKDLKSPVVFCHNDFRGSNILVTKPDQDIKLTDLEYAAFGYRGHDIANYLREWDREAFDFENHTLPEDDVIRHFVRLYVEGCDKLIPGYSTRQENSVERILKEVKIHALEGYLFFLSFMMKSEENLIASIPFDARDNMKYCDFIYGKYFEIKHRLIDDGTLQNVDF